MVMFCISQNCVDLDFGSLLRLDLFLEMLCLVLKSGVASKLFFKLWFLAVNPRIMDS